MLLFMGSPWLSFLTHSQPDVVSGLLPVSCYLHTKEVENSEPVYEIVNNPELFMHRVFV